MISRGQFGMQPRSSGRALSPRSVGRDAACGGAPESPGNRAGPPRNLTRSLEPHPSGIGGGCSALPQAPEGAQAHARATLAQPVSVAMKGDVDTEVVVVAEAPVGVGCGDRSAAGRRAGGGGFAPGEAEDADVIGWVRVRRAEGRLLKHLLRVGAPEPGPLSRRHHDQGR